MKPVLTFLLLLIATQIARPGDSGTKTPVLVELFTSEGCSSCPPADALLEALGKTQPVAGAEIIVLSEHVDYWNQIGWTDPFSSPRFSQRQQTYARRFGLDGAYTPQMVVNGGAEFVGSDKRRALAEIAKAAGAANAIVRISASPGNAFHVHVEVDGATNADVFIVLALNDAVSQVARGENGGRQLRHVAVVKQLIQIGKTTRSQRFVKDLDLTPEAAGSANRYHVVAFVQERGQGRILAARSLSLAN